MRQRLDEVLEERTLLQKIAAKKEHLRSTAKVALSSSFMMLSVFFLRPMVEGLDCSAASDGRAYLDSDQSIECVSDNDAYRRVVRVSWLGFATWGVGAALFARAILHGGQQEYAFIAAKMRPSLFW